MVKTRKILIFIVIILIVVVLCGVVYSYCRNNDYFFAGDSTQIKNGQSNGQNNDKNANKGTKKQENETSKNSNIKDADKKEDDGTIKKKQFENIRAKAVYLTGNSAGSNKVIERIIKLSQTTELNAVVIDIKEAGKVNYLSDIPEVKKYMASRKLYDPEAVIKKLHENNIYVIGRIVCFKDNVLVENRNDFAIKRADGGLWREGKVLWANPYNKEVWEYNIDIAKEAIDKGFDEIQFDYVRFPTTGKTEVYYGENLPPKEDAICEFLKTAEEELHTKKGVPVSADVFGIIAESLSDGRNIGQVLEKAGESIDYICPMVYPSHYANASHGVMGNGVGQVINGVKFTAPDLEPYKVVYNTLLKTKEIIAKTPNYKAKVRPYLQAFTASYIKNKNYYQYYGAEQIRQQVQAVYDAGYEEWILWNPSNSYSEDYFIEKIIKAY